MTDWASRLFNFRRGEFPLALLAALLFFCVLCGYFFLRPVREAMGVSRGMGDLRWLFGVTSVASLVIVLAFGGVVSRFDRRRSLPIAYAFVIACLLGFAGLLIADARAGGGLIGTDTETRSAIWVGYTFYVWLSVVNLFLTALFWAFMVDLFNVDQGKRMFAFIGIGGTLGAIVGGWLTARIGRIGEALALHERFQALLQPGQPETNWSIYLPAGLMLSGAALFCVAIIVLLMLDRLAVRSEHSRLGESANRSGQGSEPATLRPARAREGFGGSFWEGLTQVVRSPYLLGIAGFIVLMAISNTLIYFTKTNLISQELNTFSERVVGFAQFDMLAQIATLVTQMFVTTRVIRRLGVGATLAILPLVTVAGFAVLAVWPILGVMAIFQAIHRATRYAIARPARETLFSVVPPAEKYKAKPVIDVFLYRGGDLAGMGIERALSSLGSITLMAGAVVPLAAGWCILSVALGRTQTRKVARSGAMLAPGGSRPAQEGPP